MKYFITSDVHSFYTPLKTALDEVGFDVNNPEHILIVAGDLFDRGEETLKVLNFIKSIPKDRRILIRGNHEYLLRDLVYSELPNVSDFSNGTVQTCFHLAHHKLDEIYSYLYYSCDYFSYIYNGVSKEDIANQKKQWKSIADKVKKTGILDWIFSDEWIDYYELDNFIITHSFIPLTNLSGKHMYYANPSSLLYNSNWRQSSPKEFEQATWGCPYKLYDAGLFDKEKENGKILVCGHWHTFDFRQHYDNIYYRKEEDFDNSLFYRENLIALDACTVLSKFVNVLVVENDKLYYNNKEIKVGGEILQ